MKVKKGAKRRERKTAPVMPFKGPIKSPNHPSKFFLENPVALGTFLVAASLCAYLRTLLNGFIGLDDSVYITDNPNIKAGLTGATLRWSFTTFTAGYWHPLTWVSHALDMQIFGLNAAGHHMVSVAFHALNTVLLFLLLRRATGFTGRSFIVALLFALHPLNVENVAWAAERKSLLSTLFFLLGLAAYAWFARKPSIKRYAVLAIFFALGLMAKPMVITLPFALLLLDYWPLQRIEGWTQPLEPWSSSRRSALRLVLEKIPLLLLSVGSAILTVIAQARAGAVVKLSETPLLLRIKNAVRSYALYLLRAFWPSGLAVFYPEPSPNSAAVLISAALLCAISFWVWTERKRRPYLIVGWLWYLGILVPMIGLVQAGLQGMADRFVYIPLIGIFVMVVWAAAERADAITISIPLRFGAVALAALVMAALTWYQVGFWRDPVTLWTRDLDVTRYNIFAEDNLGNALMALGRDDEAMAHFNNAIRMNPNEPKVHISLAYLLRKHGDPRAAIEQCKKALSLTKDPENMPALYSNLGVAYRQIGSYDEARESFQQVLKYEPSNTEAMLDMGKIVILQAAQSLSQEMDRHPTVDGLNQLSGLWEQAGDAEHANQAYRAALSLNAKESSARK